MILVDTSVWVDHLRSEDRRLAHLLDDRRILTHPFIVGEIAVGNLKNRDEILLMMSLLPMTRVASYTEALQFISNFSLAGRGLGYIDIHLLAALSLTPGTSLWSKDKRLHSIAEELSLPTASTS